MANWKKINNKIKLAGPGKVVNVINSVFDNNTTALLSDTGSVFYITENDSANRFSNNNNIVNNWTKIDSVDLEDNVKKIAFNQNFSFIITKDNNLWYRGTPDGWGNLGFEDTPYDSNIDNWTKSLKPEFANNVKDIIITSSLTAIITIDNKIYIAGTTYGYPYCTRLYTWTEIENFIFSKCSYNEYEYISFVSTDGKVFLNGSDGSQSYFYDTTLISDPLPINGSIRDFKKIGAYLLYVTNDNNLWITDRKVNSESKVTKIETLGLVNNVADVIVSDKSTQWGEESIFILTTDNNIFVFGNNKNSQLGIDNGYTDITEFTKITSIGIENNVKSVIINQTYSSIIYYNIRGYNAFIITLDNNLYVCGYNGYGQLGVGSNTDVLTWTKISNDILENNISKIFINKNSLFAITLDDNLYTCGGNVGSDGNLNGDTGSGDNGTTIIMNTILTKISNLEFNNNVANIYSNFDSSYLISATYIITKDNEIFISGCNDNGYFGFSFTNMIGDHIISSSFIKIPNITADIFQDIDMAKLKEYVFSRSRAMVMVTTDGLLYNYNYTKDYFEYIDTSSIGEEIKSVKIVGDNIFVTTNTNKLYQISASSVSKPQDNGDSYVDSGDSYVDSGDSYAFS